MRIAVLFGALGFAAAKPCAKIRRQYKCERKSPCDWDAATETCADAAGAGAFGEGDAGFEAACADSTTWYQRGKKGKTCAWLCGNQIFNPTSM